VDNTPGHQVDDPMNGNDGFNGTMEIDTGPGDNSLSLIQTETETETRKGQKTIGRLGGKYIEDSTKRRQVLRMRKKQILKLVSVANYTYYTLVHYSW
jgi:hypothetical protein